MSFFQLQGARPFDVSGDNGYADIQVSSFLKTGATQSAWSYPNLKPKIGAQKVAQNVPKWAKPQKWQNCQERPKQPKVAQSATSAKWPRIAQMAKNGPNPKSDPKWPNVAQILKVAQSRQN